MSLGAGTLTGSRTSGRVDGASTGRPAGRQGSPPDEGIGQPIPGRRGTAMTTPMLTRPELTRADRCDRCGAAAQVRAVLSGGGELLFCGHHAREHEAKLKELSADIQR